MFSAVLGLFSQEVALDLGTSNTRLYLRGRGTGLQHPTVVAVHTSRGGRRRVMAIGDEARPMLGRTPSDILAVQPVRDGQIQDFEVMEALLLHMLRRVHGRNGWMSPRMVVTVPALATDMERRAVRECCEAAGAREVHLVPKPLAAALGAGLPVHEPAGQMVVDLGGGSTEIAVVSLNGVVTSQVVPGGGEGMDRALQDHVRAQHGLLIGRTTAEDLKIALGTTRTDRGGGSEVVAGRCMTSGVPRAVEITAAEVCEALLPCVERIAAGIRRTLERAPPELASDIVDHGALLVGGASKLRRIDTTLREATGLPVVVAEHPMDSVVEGAGLALEQSAVLERLAS